MVYIIEDTARPEIQAVFLKVHLRCLIAGMKGRMTGKQVLSCCTNITGVKYPSSKKGYQRALDDLKKVIANPPPQLSPTKEGNNMKLTKGDIDSLSTWRSQFK